MESKGQTRIQAACLSAGMVTVWAASGTSADTIVTDLQADITPTQEITDAYLVYGSGFSSPAQASYLGTLPANDTTRINIGRARNYVLLGVYDKNGDTGFSVSFLPSDASQIIGLKTFDDVFADTNDSLPDVTEVLMLENFGPGVPNRYGWAKSFYYDFFAGSDPYEIQSIEDSTLVNFSTGTYGGTFVIVPEPTPYMSLIMIAGLLFYVQPRRAED